MNYILQFIRRLYALSLKTQSRAYKYPALHYVKMKASIRNKHAYKFVVIKLHKEKKKTQSKKKESESKKISNRLYFRLNLCYA